MREQNLFLLFQCVLLEREVVTAPITVLCHVEIEVVRLEGVDA